MWHAARLRNASATASATAAGQADLVGPVAGSAFDAEEDGDGGGDAPGALTAVPATDASSGVNVGGVRASDVPSTAAS
jgi:hypothetical protein